MPQSANLLAACGSNFEHSVRVGGVNQNLVIVLIGAVLCGCNVLAANTNLHATPTHGGRLVACERTEPSTFNPATALDAVSREVIGLMSADLIHIDRATLDPVAEIADHWTRSRNGRRYTVHLRQGVRFSDGHALDADDVLFSFRVHLDERVRSPQRELLIIGGKPIVTRKLDSQTILFELAEPRASAERLFDSIAILPQHLLATAYKDGKLSSTWALNTPPAQIAGLGPFRLKEYIPGQRVTLERNPYYWKHDSRGEQLPYLDEVTFLFAGNEAAQIMRFEAGEIQVLSTLTAEAFQGLRRTKEAAQLELLDEGPGLQYTFLLLNLNRSVPSGSIEQKQRWFRDVAFRQALSAAIDRDALVRVAFNRLATPLWGHVTEGNKAWINRTIPHPPHSIERARELLRAAGFCWNSAGRLVDPSHREIAFSILTNSNNEQRTRIATILQDDLKQLGIPVSVVSLEFRTMLDRIFNTFEYDAAIMSLDSGDTDPSADMNVWVSKGSTHLWDLKGDALEPWQHEIDSLMRQQLITLNPTRRKQLYDRVQYLVSQYLPVIPLVSPHVLVAATSAVGNFRPSILRPYALWNGDQLFLNKIEAHLK